MTISSSSLVGLMAEPDRRRVVATLILSAGDLAHVVQTSGLDQRAAVEALDRLSTAGLVEVGAEGVYVILEEAFKLAARAEKQPTDPGDRSLPADATAQIVAQCFVDGALIHMPRKRTKRMVVLDHVAQEFEPGTRYSEREVNVVLRPIYPDHVTLRRYLVDDGYLDRADGIYWRSGGTI